MKTILFILSIVLFFGCSSTNKIKSKPHGKLEYIKTWDVGEGEGKMLLDVFDDLNTSNSVDIIHYYLPDLLHTTIGIQTITFENGYAEMICEYFNGREQQRFEIDYEALLDKLFMVK